MADILEIVNSDFENIEKVLLEIKELLSQGFFDKHQINSAALFLHNIYNGIENIIKNIFKFYNIPIPNTKNWHKDLLKLAKDKEYIDESIYSELLKYAGFRHIVVHNYFYNIDLELMLPLLKSINELYVRFKNRIINLFN